MEVIDKILSEWSYRCHDGIVDMNDPKKLVILNEILKEYNLLKEDIEGDILTLLDTADDEKKQKVLALLQRDEDEIKQLKQQIAGSKEKKERVANEIANIRKTLIDHGLSKPYAYFVTSIFIEADKEDELINYFKNLPLLEVIDGINIKSKPKELLKSDDLVDDVYKHLAGSAKTKGIGKEENFLVIFYGNVTKEAEGDITVNNDKYEVKGVGSMVVPPGINRGSKQDVINFLTDELNLNQEDKNLFIKKERWPYTIAKLYEKSSNKTEFFNTVQKALNIKYKNINISEDLLKNGQDLAKAIAKHLILNSGIKDTEKILFIFYLIKQK
jgi:hypothetical protein